MSKPEEGGDILSQEDIDKMFPTNKADSETAQESANEGAGNSEILSQEDVDALLELEEGAGRQEEQELNPDRIKKAWQDLSEVEKKFISTVNDEKFEEILAKSPDRQKALVMRGLRKLIKNNDPLASKIER